MRFAGSAVRRAMSARSGGSWAGGGSVSSLVDSPKTSTTRSNIAGAEVVSIRAGLTQICTAQATLLPLIEAQGPVSRGTARPLFG